MTGAVLYTNSAGLLTDYSHHGVNGVPDNAFRITPDLTLLGRKVRVPSDVNYLGTPTTWVFAKARDAKGVADALTNGRGSISANAVTFADTPPQRGAAITASRLKARKHPIRKCRFRACSAAR
ncbi:MAG: hypothetical protein ACRCS5_11390 [Sphingomonas sp.]|uniref:hypothetical protein n=1 Tax=Sphingomonas sp. TaxID=28214 RepID=UPI0030FB118B